MAALPRATEERPACELSSAGAVTTLEFIVSRTPVAPLRFYATSSEHRRMSTVQPGMGRRRGGVIHDAAEALLLVRAMQCENRMQSVDHAPPSRQVGRRRPSGIEVGDHAAQHPREVAHLRVLASHRKS